MGKKTLFKNIITRIFVIKQGPYHINNNIYNKRKDIYILNRRYVLNKFYQQTNASKSI